MKKTAIEKTIIALTVTAFVLLLIGVGYIVGQVFILDPAFGLNFQNLKEVLLSIGSWFDFVGNGVYDLPRIIALSVVGALGIIVPIIWVILIIKFRKPLSLLVLLTWYLVLAAVLYDYAMLHPYLLGVGTPLMDSYWNGFMSELAAPRIMNVVIFLIPHALLVLSFLFAIPSMIVDMVYCAKSPTAPKRRVAHAMSSEDDKVILVREEPQPLGPSGDEIREIIREEIKDEPVVAVAPAPAPVVEHEPVKPVHASETISGLSGPLIVQYINTYGRQEEVRPAPAPAPAPAPVVEKVDYGKIRDLIREELLDLLTEEVEEYEEVEEEVVPVQEEVVHAPAPEVHHVGPTLDEIRAMVREEVVAGTKKEEKTSPIIVNVPPAPPAPVKEPLTKNQVRSLIANELARLVEKEAAAPKKEEAPAPAPAPVVVHQPVDDNHIRKLIAGELSKLVEEPVETEKKNKIESEEPSLTKEDIRVILEEVLNRQVVVKEVIKEVPVVVKEVVKEVPVVQEPKPKKVSEPAPVKAKVDTPRPAAVKVAREYERIPFQTRMKSAEKEMKANYNELKSEVLSYGVKSRVSNTGDTFRLHTKTYLKITIAGKSLKLYFALDPKNYEKTTLPVQDASHIGIYKDIPLIFKVKSALSMKRAKQLIADVMEADNLEQGKVEPHNWVKEIK
ncbi:MAG: hypothetical protein GX132_01410 [Erysipelotrichia bacterium]|nr:hypothetical protein [Erysipelotrichia bacterium]